MSSMPNKLYYEMAYGMPLMPPFDAINMSTIDYDNTPKENLQEALQRTRELRGMLHDIDRMVKNGGVRIDLISDGRVLIADGARGYIGSTVFSAMEVRMQDIVNRVADKLTYSPALTDLGPSTGLDQIKRAPSR